MSIRFSLPSDQSKYVDLKSEWTYGDTKAITKAKAAAANDTEGAMAGSDVILQRFITGWSFEDVPSASAFDERLSDADALAIVKRCFELRGPEPGPNP